MAVNSGKLAGVTMFITGASRGIGKAIALKAAKDGANIVIAAKTAEPHPKLPGTIYTAAKEVEAAGGKAMPCIVDVRDEAQVQKAVEEAVKKFGGIDILVNNASAISLTPTLQTDMKRYDLMNSINARGTFLVSKVCIPYLLKSKNPHILNISPPLNMVPHWFENHVAYTMAKYGMSMCVLGMHKEFKDDGIAVNALWPRTAVHTAAIEMLSGSDSARFARKTDIMADAAYVILTKDSRKVTGNFFIDDEVLTAAGITDLAQYACDPSNAGNLSIDFFLDEKVKLSAPDPLGPKAGLENLFQSIKEKLNPQLVQSVQAVFAFNVTGAEPGKWFLDLKSGGGAVGRGQTSSRPDTTLTIDSNDLIDLFSGKLKAIQAYTTGKLKISGNAQLAMKLEEVLNVLKQKSKL